METEEAVKPLPEGVREALNQTLLNVEELRSNLDQLLSLSQNPNPELPPLQRAHSLLTLASATSTLFALRLRCTGLCPDSQPINKDLHRIGLFQAKLDRCLRLSQDPIRPTTQLNSQAATRFIRHSLPDLAAQQARSLRELSKNEAGRVGFSDTSFQRKRKSRYQPPVVVKRDQPPVIVKRDQPPVIVKRDQPTSPAFFPSPFSKKEDFLPLTASQVFHSKQRIHKEHIVPVLIEDSSEEEEEGNKELEEDDDRVEEALDDGEIEYEEDDGEIEYEEEGDEIYYEEEDDEILQLPPEEDGQLLDDDEEKVEEEQKQEMKGPPVFIILDSSDED